MSRLRGGDRAGEEMPIEFKDGTPDEQADRALARLTGLVAQVRRSATRPISRCVHPMWSDALRRPTTISRA